VTDDATAARRARMASLLLTDREPRRPVDVVRWFGAMQAQDAASGHWSLGVRCGGSTEADILAAFERREIVRTWPMRGTLHMVAAEDARWLLDHVGIRALDSAAGRRAALGITDEDVDRALAALDHGLAGGVCATRSDALALVSDAGVDVSGQRAYHLLWFAAQVGVTCLGPQRGSDPTVVRLADWAPDQVVLTRDEAHAELLFRYVRSHGPAPLQDFAGWAGLTVGEARAAAAANAGRLEPLGSGARALWRVVGPAHEDPPRPPTRALPGFDEFILGYKDRSLQVPEGGLDRIVPGGNGVFRATVALDGAAVATWLRKVGRKDIAITVDPFAAIGARDRADAEESLADYGRFLGLPVRVAWT
jgi:hypothetical protein